MGAATTSTAASISAARALDDLVVAMHPDDATDHAMLYAAARSVPAESASRVPVPLPIAFHGFGHIPGSRAQPIWFSVSQVPQNVGDLAFASQVNICGFRAHGIEKRFLVALFPPIRQFHWIFFPFSRRGGRG